MLPSVLQRRTTDHIPVLADEVRRLLAVQPGETVVDGTFGAGGHAALLAADLRGQGRYIAIDRDPSVRAVLRELQASRSGACSRDCCAASSRGVLEALAANGVEADVVLLDLGVSSMQLDVPERGLLVRNGRAARHAHGSIRRAHAPPTSSTSDRSASSQTSSSATVRSVTRGRSRARSCAGARSSRLRARRRVQVRDTRARALRRRASGEARLPGAADRRQR